MENVSTVPPFEDSSGPPLSVSATMAGGVLACILSALGIFGNLVTVVSLVRDRKLRAQATSVFVISLAVSDLLFCSINLPLTAVRFFQRAWTLGPLLCRLYPFFFYGNYAASLISMAAIAVTRYLLIAHFSLYTRCFTKPLIAVVLLAVWVFSFGWMVPPLLSVWGTLGEDKDTFTCTIKRDERGRSPKMFLFLLGFTLPCLAIITCYSAIFYRVRTSRQAVGISTPVSYPRSLAVMRMHLREDLQLTKTMLTIFVVFLVTFLPAVLSNVLEHMLPFPILHLVASILSWTSAVINPLVYSLLHHQYKEAFRRTVFWCRTPSTTSLQTTTGSTDSVLDLKDFVYRPNHLSLHCLSKGGDLKLENTKLGVSSITKSTSAIDEDYTSKENTSRGMSDANLLERGSTADDVKRSCGDSDQSKHGIIHC